MENWYPEFEKRLVEQLKGTKESDLRFFRIEEYFRNAERVDQHAADCHECYSFRQQMDQSRDLVARAVQHPGQERRRLDDMQAKINEHMRKSHGFYPPYYHTYMQSIYWTIGLMAVACLLTFVFPDMEKAVFYSPAFAVGVVTGQIIGGKKDRKIRETNKIL